MVEKKGSPKTKVCRRCDRRKARHLFRSNPKLKDGLSSYCRACHIEAQRESRRRHPEKVAAYNAARRSQPKQRKCYTCEQPFKPEHEHEQRCPDCVNNVPWGERAHQAA